MVKIEKAFLRLEMDGQDCLAGEPVHLAVETLFPEKRRGGDPARGQVQARQRRVQIEGPRFAEMKHSEARACHGVLAAAVAEEMLSRGEVGVGGFDLTLDEGSDQRFFLRLEEKKIVFDPVIRNDQQAPRAGFLEG